MLTWLLRRHMDRGAAELTALIALAGALDVAAGTGLAYLAGWGPMWSVLSQPRWPWLAAMTGALCVSFGGYYYAYRGIYRAEGGYRLPGRLLFAVVAAGFGGFFAHWGTSPDDLALRRAGANARESVVRAGALGGVEQAVLALAGSVASVFVLCLGLPAPPLAGTLPWVIIPLPAAVVAWWAARRYATRLRGRGGWRGKVSTALDAIRLASGLLLRPRRNWPGLAGLVVFWAAEMFAIWAGLAAFGLVMNPAALVVGFCTGMVTTRRVAPLAGTGLLTLALSLTLWYSGAPLAVAVAGTFAYRALTLWLPMPVALATLPVLRQLSLQAQAPRPADGPPAQLTSATGR